MLLIRYTRPDEGQNIEVLLKELELFHSGSQLEKIIVAEDAGRLVGMANVRTSGGYSELTHVGVLSRYRKQGIASRLIARIVRDVPGPIYINTVVPSFFARLGFESTEDFPRQFNKPAGWCSGCDQAACTSMVRRGTGTV